MFIFTLKYSQLQVIQQQKFKCIGKTISSKDNCVCFWCARTHTIIHLKKHCGKKKMQWIYHWSKWVYIYLHVPSKLYTQCGNWDKSLVNIVYYITKHMYFTMILPNVTNPQINSIHTVLIFFPGIILFFFPKITKENKVRISGISSRLFFVNKISTYSH